MTWKIELDGSWEREGFDQKTIEGDGVVVTRAERFDLGTIFVIVVTYLGGKLLDKVTDQALSKPVDGAIDKLLTFVESKEKQLRIVLRDEKFDPRIRVLGAQIDSGDFQAARDALPTIRTRVARLLDVADEELSEAWYVWQDGEWTFSYYLTKSGDVVDKEPGAKG